jgi:actin-related protein
MKMWENFKGNHKILAAKLDTFVGTSRQRKLMTYNKEGDRPPKQKANVKERFNNYKRKNSKVERNQRRRYQCARCQDMFEECVRKLAELVTNNNLDYLEPTRQSPEVKQIVWVYKDLWGKKGTSDSKIPQSKASVGLIHEYFPPIVAEERGYVRG